jgi:hypothetical protein
MTDDDATIDITKEIKGTLVTRKEWKALTADQLREALTWGDMLVVREDDGPYIAISAREYGDDIEHNGDYFRPAWSIEED